MCALKPSLNPFGTGQGLSTHQAIIEQEEDECLNPFGTGQGLSTHFGQRIKILLWVSIPLEQGRVFRQCCGWIHDMAGTRLNPFGTGQGLSTNVVGESMTWLESLNPFGTGQGLSTRFSIFRFYHRRSQSLWNRAGSFDSIRSLLSTTVNSSQSLWNRAGSFDNHGRYRG